jgi:hypothetical protein
MNKCIRHLVLIPLVLFTGLSLCGQNRENKEQIKALKVAFFTEKLQLTPEEASVFWPIYNAHENAKEELRTAQRKEIMDRFETLDNLQEQEAKSALERYLDLEEKEEELDKAFYQRIAREFSAVRTLKLFQAEQEFRRRLLQEYRKRRGR